MSNIRYKILQKLAQTTTTTPDASIPSPAVATTQSVSGSPPDFTPSAIYPGINKAFGTRNAAVINGLANILSQSLYYTSNGQVSLSSMKNNNFGAGTSDVPSPNLRNLMNFAKAVYNSLFTYKGQEYKEALKPEQIKTLVDALKANQSLSNLPVTSLTNQLSTKIGGNTKTIINNLLLNIL